MKDKNVAKSSSTTIKTTTTAIDTQKTTTAKTVSTTPPTTANPISVYESPPNATEVKKAYKTEGFIKFEI